MNLHKLKKIYKENIMAHYAKLGANNKVIAVHVVNDKDCQNADGVEDEEVGRQFLERIHSWPFGKKHLTIHKADIHKTAEHL